jgi:hypothetical protein
MDMDVQHICSMDNGQVSWTCTCRMVVDMQLNIDMDIQHGHGSIDMDMQNGPQHVAWT